MLFDLEKYDGIYNRVRYPASQISGIIYVTSHNYAGIKVGYYDSLHLTFHVLIVIKSFFNKDRNHYYYNIFL